MAFSSTYHETISQNMRCHDTRRLVIRAMYSFLHFKKYNKGFVLFHAKNLLLAVCAVFIKENKMERIATSEIIV